MRGFSKWVCGQDEMNAKTDNMFNDPFGVGALIENLERQESPEGCRDLVGFESI